MPSIQTSLLTATPAGAGQTLPGLCMAGVRRYIASRLPEKAVSAAPASRFGTTGSSRAAPVAISVPASSFPNVAGGMLARNGNALAAAPCRAWARSSVACHFSQPVCRM